MSHSRQQLIEEKSGEGPDRLSNLTHDLLRYSLFSRLPLSAREQLRQTNRKFSVFPDKETKIALELLLYFVSHGQKYQAEALISQDSGLLLLEGRARDYSGRKLQGTALEIALGAEDVNLYANSGTLLGEGMVEMLHRHLRKLPDGEAEIARQTLRQFPEGWEEQEEKRHEGDLNALRKVRKAIGVSRNNEECKAALLEFKKYLAPQGIIATGKHWNARLLQAAFHIGYKKYFNDFRKDCLFYSEVVGSIQALAPANYAMAQAQGLKYLNGGKIFQRDLNLRSTWDDGPAHYYPLSSSGPRLGSDFWIDGYLGVAKRRANWGGWCMTAQLNVFFEMMLEKKQKYCDDLCRSQTITKTRGLAVS